MTFCPRQGVDGLCAAWSGDEAARLLCQRVFGDTAVARVDPQPAVSILLNQERSAGVLFVMPGARAAASTAAAHGGRRSASFVRRDQVGLRRISDLGFAGDGQGRRWLSPRDGAHLGPRSFARGSG